MNIYEISKLPEFIHLSTSSVINTKEYKYKQFETIKPRGIYYAKNLQWLNFVINEMGYKGIKITKKFVKIKKNIEQIYEKKLYKYNWYLYNVIIPNDIKIYLDDKPNRNKILVIKSFNDVKKITSLYCNAKYSTLWWSEISKYYGGIELCNYKETINEMFGYHDANIIYKKYTWYMTFDVDGGCIWNMKCLKLVKIKPTVIK
jgi:hypothetical protein